MAEGSSSPDIRIPLVEPLAPNTVRVGNSSPRRNIVKQEQSVAQSLGPDIAPSVRIDTSASSFEIKGRPDSMPFQDGSFTMNVDPVRVVKPQPSEVAQQAPENRNNSNEPVEAEKSTFAEWLKNEMSRRNKSIRAISDIVGVDHSGISRLVSSDSMPNLDTFSKLLKYFDDGKDPDFDHRLKEMLVNVAGVDLNEKPNAPGVSTPEILSGTFKEQLNGYIESSRLSARGLADKAGINHTTISRIRTSDRLPSIDVLIKMSKALGLDLYHLKGMWAAVASGELTEEEAQRLTLSKQKAASSVTGKPDVLPAETMPKVEKTAETIKPKKPDITWLESQNLTPDLMKRVIEAYKEVFGKVPEDYGDYEDPSSLANYTAQVVDDLFRPGGLGFAEHGKLEIVRLVNEKGKFMRFKISPYAKKYDRRRFDEIVADMLANEGAVINNREAVGKPVEFAPIERVSSRNLRQGDQLASISEGLEESGEPFVDWLENYITKKRISQSDLSRLTGIDRSVISRLMSGQQEPNARTFANIIIPLSESEPGLSNSITRIVEAYAPEIAKRWARENARDDGEVRYLSSGSLAEQVRDYMTREGLSARGLAYRSGMEHTTVSRLISAQDGEAERVPTMSTFGGIAFGLGLDSTQIKNLLKSYSVSDSVKSSSEMAA
jgi:transcriptional regulator with XRE-family HTH domain